MSASNLRVTGRGRSLPPFKTVEAALRKTTETLARELACPTSLRPDWSDFEWRIAHAVAALQGVSSLLCQELRWQGPTHWQQFLAEQRDHTIRRQQLIEQLLTGLDYGARRAGIALVALKGAALHAMGVYRAGQRPMGDIDLLVRETDVDAAGGVIMALGYSKAFSTWKHHVFAPDGVSEPTAGFGENVANPIKIELHTRIAERLPAFAIDIAALASPRQSHPGINDYPSIASLMTHLLLHAAGNMRARALRLLQLHDIAQLAPRMGHQDWDDLLTGLAGDRGVWWTLPPLTLAARYYPTVIPREVISAVEPACPWLLGQRARRHQLADVSWSNLRIQAFPGIEWSRTPREALSFIMSRLKPGRAALADLERVAQQEWAARIPWYGLSHRRRILRWIFSRPPRVQTMWSVRLALGDKP
jgi:Uncharacterised nucleotidyltransferase